ncbi:conserved membrane protein of unknown function [Petrocella atlantisensis]|uniref:Uncharacterized protein n=1 Tax=Petrocella atlantisensis TaxID=2173034 RepID=A0A3P7SAD5_9FIRM|nr:hypothetical protein [Petrocella atlantisensis]VDN48829.1 conserved membrane protein of unknown function [Petrocella atlantisensis]
MTKKTTRDIIIQTLSVAVVAFVFQLIWEYSQCGPFYIMDDDLAGHTRLMISATVGDMNMSLLLLWMLMFINKDVNWLIGKWHRHDYIIMVFYALFISFFFEIHALHTGRWGYNPDTMPIIPGTPIGWLPVIQLLILFPIIFMVSRKVYIQLTKGR